MEQLSKTVDNLSVMKRKFIGKDKTRFYVRELVRKGSK